MTATKPISRCARVIAAFGLLGLACNLISQAVVIPTAAQLPSETPTLVPRSTLPPSWTPTFTWTPTATPTVTSTPTPTLTSTPTPTDTPTPTFTPTATRTPRPRPTVTVRPSTPPTQPIGFTAAPPPGIGDIEARLWAVPIIPTVSERARQIFAAGQALGNRAQVFSKVGDCHTVAHAFLLPLGVGEYDLGPYGFLQADVGFFAVSPRQGVPNSFENQSMAASSAFNAAAVLDSVWSDPTHCQPGESPLECEYRLVMPSVAIITLGSVDVQLYGADQFRASLSSVVQITINRGIIPVLVMFPTHPDYFGEAALAFNAVIVDIAQREQIPVVNFWRASRELPNFGLEADNFHFSHPESRFISFNGEERQYGVALHNLLVMLTLDTLRLNVLSG